MKTKRAFKSTNELVGAYIESRWNGMSDIFKVVGVTPKGLKLEECQLEDLGAESDDPTWLKFKIAFNKDVSLKSRGKPITKRVRLSQDGEILMPKIGWDGYGETSVIAMDDDEAKNVVISQWWD